MVIWLRVLLTSTLHGCEWPARAVLTFGKCSLVSAGRRWVNVRVSLGSVTKIQIHTPPGTEFPSPNSHSPH